MCAYWGGIYTCRSEHMQIRGGSERVGSLFPSCEI